MKKFSTKSASSHPATPFLVFGLAIALMAYLAGLFGPIDMGSKQSLGKLLPIIGIPFLAVAALYDPVTRAMDWLRARTSEPEEATALSMNELDDAAERARKLRDQANARQATRRATHPVSSHLAAPYLFWITIGTLIIGLIWVLNRFNLLSERQSGTAAYLIVTGVILAAIPSYDPVMRWFDGRVGQPSESQ